MISGKDRRSLRAYRVGAYTLVLSIVVGMFQAFPHPAAIDFLQPEPAAAETLSNPKFISAAVMPNGEVGLLYANGDNGVNTAAEIRFSRYTTEHAMPASIQLSTAGPAYPQLATFRGRLVAGYVDTRGSNVGKFIVRVSDDSGVSWSAESYLFSGETFNGWTFAPRLVASRDGQTLYFFHAPPNTIPQYRSTTDSTVVTWTSPAPAGDASMRQAKNNSCGASGGECYRAHAISLMETATAGTWIYIAKSDSGFGQSGRGTQVGTLGGSWSVQVDHGGSGGLTGCCGESTATTFLDRAGNVIYLRAGSYGDYLYYKKSTNGGLTWGAAVSAYAETIPNYTTAAPVGLYDPNYSLGEYVWYAGFGGSENTLRVVPLWSAPTTMSDSGTVRILGSAGGDLDPGGEWAYNFGDRLRSLGGGSYSAGAEDLRIPGRLIDLSFTRTYNSAAGYNPGPLGRAWTHSYNWRLLENGDLVTILRGDGAEDRFNRNPDATYASPQGVFDTLVKNPDLSFTLTTRGQVALKFVFGLLTQISEPAGNTMTLFYPGVSATNLIRFPVGATPSYTAIREYSADYVAAYAANGVINNGFGGGISWATNGWIAGDWWKVTWSAAQSINRVKLWDRTQHTDYWGNGHLLFSDGSTVPWTGLPADPGPNGENFLELSFPRKTGITWMQAISDSGGTAHPGLAEIEAYNDPDVSPPISANGKLAAIVDTLGRRVELTYDATRTRLVAVTDPIGRKITYAYDGGGRLATVVDKIGNTAGQDPNLHKWQYGYDGSSTHLTTITDPDGRVVVTNTYGPDGRLATQKNGINKTTTFVYGSGQTTITDPRGHQTVQTWDARNRPIQQDDQVGAATYRLIYTYDGCGNRSSVTDRNGNRTDYGYDCRGNLIQLQEPQLGPSIPRYTTNLVYDANNNPLEITDARSFVTTNTYDPVKNVPLSTTRQITSAPATYAVTKWEYSDAGNPGLPTKVISPRGNTTPTPNYAYSQTLSYDALGNLTTTIDADGNQTTFGYDAVSRRTTMVDPDGYASGGVPSEHTWTTAYDPNDRVTQATDPLAKSALTGYDGAGNRTTVTDRNGNVTTYMYDNATQLANVKQKPDPIGQPALEYTTTVVRDDNGNATQVTQANGMITEYVFDELNRTTSVITHPTGVLQLTTSYILDGNGSANSRTAGDGVVTSYQYDALSRLIEVSAAGLSTIAYGYDELSRRTSMVDGTGTSTYAYDGLGRLTQAVQPNGTLGYGYDLDSNRTTLTYPTVGNVTYVFSPASRLTSLTDWGTRQSAYTYSAAGLAKTVTVPGGMTTTYTYDKAQRLTSLVNSTAGGTITSDTYTLDNEGNRTAIDEVINAAVASVKVNTDTGTAVQDHPAIAAGADGAGYLIWDDARDGNANIYFSKRDALTGVWDTNVKVNNDTGTRIQLNPAVSMDSSNNAYAVWQDERNGAGKADIFYSKRTSAGTWLTPNLKVSDDPGGGGGAVQRNPRIAGTAAGAETAVWVDLRASQNNIYSSQLPAGGTSWPANKKITDNTAALKDFPDVTVDTANTAYAVWQDSRNGNADIFFSTLASGGAAWAANLKISDDPGSAAQTSPRIGIDSAGNLTAVWLDARTTPTKVRAARKPAGGAWSASIEVSPAPANAQSLALSVRADGYAWATWADTRAGASNADIWGSRYDPYLSSWSAPQRLDDDPGTTAAQLNPTVAFSASETMLAWRDNRLSANGDTQARRLVFAPGLIDHFALAYDGLNRLKSVTGPVSETFALDQASNVTSRSGTAETYDNANRLTADGSTALTWSNADRLTNRGADTFGYDALDRLTSSTVASTARGYTYNGDGLLKSRTQGTATQFLWDPASSPSRLLTQGGDNIVYGLGPLYVVKADATTLTFARDGSKNVRAEVSSTGAVTAAFRYRAYGQLAQSITTGPAYLGLASQLLDPSGLYYMRARWYEPVTGRFITRDPMQGDAGTPMSLNAFAYAYANPNRNSDPSGMCPFCLIPVAIWIGVELGMFGFDVIDTTQTVLDPSVSELEKGLAVAGFTAGLALPGGGYGFGMRTGARFVVDSAGVTRIFLSNGLEVSSHAARRVAERPGLSIDLVDDIVTNQPGFNYWHAGVEKTGFYDSVRNVFVGSVNGVVTTVFSPDDGADYVRRLIGALP